VKFVTMATEKLPVLRSFFLKFLYTMAESLLCF